MKFLIITIAASLGLNFTLQDFMASPQNSRVTITGTSTLHPWQAEVRDFKITSYLNFYENSGSASAVFYGKSITSGKSVMDSKIYEALKVDEFPEINFEWKQIAINGDHIITKGNLTVAGVKRDATIKLNYTKTGNEVKVTGSHPINMLDFNLTPPTAMFGAIKSGEVITLHFDLNFTPASITKK